MIKFILLSSVFLGLFLVASAQQNPVITVTLHSNTPLSITLQDGAQNVDVARIILTASGADAYINGIYVDTDVIGGLSNFNNIFIYDAYDNSLLGFYPNLSQNPNLISIGNVIIGNGLSKTYLVRASLSSFAAGDVRVGFSGFSYPTQAEPTLSGMPIYGNVMTLPGTVATPIPTPLPTVLVSPVPSPTATPLVSTTPSSRGFISLSAFGLIEGDTISVAGSPSTGSGQADDPDIYIANEFGYKRLFLNPVIFGFYGHLGGFSSVKTIASSTRDIMVTSGLFRNCDLIKSSSATTGQEQSASDKVYALEVTGEDTGILHWVNTTGDQAVADDPDFFKKVFCINSAELNWYGQGSAYTSVNQVPPYSRQN